MTAYTDRGEQRFVAHISYADAAVCGEPVDEVVAGQQNSEPRQRHPLSCQYFWFTRTSQRHSPDDQIEEDEPRALPYEGAERTALRSWATFRAFDARGRLVRPHRITGNPAQDRVRPQQCPIGQHDDRAPDEALTVVPICAASFALPRRRSLRFSPARRYESTGAATSPPRSGLSAIPIVRWYRSLRREIGTQRYQIMKLIEAEPVETGMSSSWPAMATTNDPRETDDFHLAVETRGAALGTRRDGRSGKDAAIGMAAQHVARVVANATRLRANPWPDAGSNV